MTLEALEKRLDYGEEWGFVKQTEDENLLGWILITKRKPRSIPPFEPEEDPKGYRQFLAAAERIRRNPYHVLIIEVSKEAHETGDYLENEDIHLRENYYVASLKDVEEIVLKYGHRLEDARPRWELKAP